MVKRIGNVIGTPVEPTSTSATGTFTITSQQQKNISVKFPKAADRGNLYTDVSVLGNMGSALVGGQYTARGDLLVRYSDNREWLDRDDYLAIGGINNSMGSRIFRQDTTKDGAELATATVCYVTNHTTGQISRYTADSSIITGSYTSDYDGQGAKTFRHHLTSGDTAHLPRVEDPLTFDGGNHKYLKLSLTRFATNYVDPQNEAGGIPQTPGSSTMLGTGIYGKYTVQVYPDTNLGVLPQSKLSDTLHDPSAPNYSNTADCTYIGPAECDILLVAGGGAGGRLYNYVGTLGNHASRPDISSGSGGAGGVMVAYNVPLTRANSFGGIVYNITVGQGGDKYGSAQAANGTGSSAMGCFVPGGGHGAWAGVLPNIIPGGNGGCGGGSISHESHSAGEKLAGFAGISTISASATTVVGGKYYLYGTDGGMVPGGNFISEFNNTTGREAWSANSTYAATYGMGNVRSKAVGNSASNDGGGIGGGAAHMGCVDAGLRRGSNGVYVSWCTPDLTHLSIKAAPIPVSAGTATLPLFEGMAYNNPYKNINDGTRFVSTDGAFGPKENYQGGYFGGSGSTENQEDPGKGGGGIGARRNNTNYSAEQTSNIGIAWPNGSTITLGIDGLDGTGGGGGSVFADNMKTNSSVQPLYGGSGGDGIVVLRFPRNQFTSRFLGANTAEDFIEVNDYILIVFRTSGSIAIQSPPLP